MGTLWIYNIVHDGVSINLDMAGLFSETGIWSITGFGQNPNMLFVCSYKEKTKRNMKKNYMFSHKQLG